MIKRAMLQSENVWIINENEGFERKMYENIIIAITKKVFDTGRYTYLVKETKNNDKVQIIGFNYPEPTTDIRSIKELCEEFDIFICDNLKEVADLVEENGWKL